MYIKDCNINSIIDWQYLHHVCENDAELELELLEIFVIDAAIHIEALKSAIAVRDFRSIAWEAHHIKGSGGNIGASQIHLNANQIEQLAFASQIENIIELITLMENDIDHIQNFLNTLSNIRT